MASNYSNASLFENTDISIPRPVRFWLLLPVNILSLACALLHLYLMLTNSTLLRTLSNHSIIALILMALGTQVIDVPFYINFTRLGYVWPQTPLLCLVWWYADVGTVQTVGFLVTWTSFERHVLIFHEKHLANRKKRWLFHYLPLIFFIVYPLLFYLLALVLVTCDNPSSYDYTQPWCNFSPCYYNLTPLSLWDILFNSLFCNILAVFFDVTLIIRVLWHRHIRLRNPIQWRKHRRMIIQVLSISITYTGASTPILTYYLLDTFGCLPNNVDPQIQLYLLFFALFGTLLLPLAMIFTLPKGYWWDKWRKVLFDRRRHRRVVTNPIMPAVVTGRTTKPSTRTVW